LLRQVNEYDKGQTELKSLLSKLQSHIHNGNCPLCGEDHGSKDELLQRIQAQLTANTASDYRVQLTVAREKLAQATERVATTKSKQQSIQTQLALLNDERTVLDAQIRKFDDSAASIGIVIEPAASKLAEQLQKRFSEVHDEITELGRQAQATTATILATRTTLAEATNQLAAKVEDEANRSEELSQCAAALQSIQSDPRLTQVSLNIDAAELANKIEAAISQLADQRSAVEAAKSDASHKRTEAQSLELEVSTQNDQLSTLRSQLATLQRNQAQIEARLREAGLPVDVTSEMLLSLVSDQSRGHAQLLELQNAVTALEMALDAVTTAAALTTLQQNLRNKEEAVAVAAQKRDQHVPWLTYFTKLGKLVSTQQNDAIASFTTEYGPRTSVIQRRLRSVYGFDEVDIQSHEATIRVRVKRRGEELRPTDYFSQSQQQTLLLALFLTACISQTWSGFAPVFMDDPVTHFDDLNTYAFLDLITGLLDTEYGKRQFIISTCDMKLLQLARQKFRHLGDRAVFYSFDAIGPDGPVVQAYNYSH
jgi:exonuclease SbcC